MTEAVRSWVLRPAPGKPAVVFLFLVASLLPPTASLKWSVCRVDKRVEILERLEKARHRRDHIVAELKVATEKLESRARRAEVARSAMRAWCSAKNLGSLRLRAVLSVALGRRAWTGYLECVVEAGASGRKMPKQELESPSRSGVSSVLMGEEPLPTDERVAGTAGGVYPDEAIGSPVGAEVAGVSPPTATIPAREPPSEKTTSRGGERWSGGGGDASEADGEHLDLQHAVAALYLALDALFIELHASGSNQPIASSCAEFAASWPRGKLPGCLDPSHLEEVWAAAGQTPPSRDTILKSLANARDALSLEAERLLLEGFWESDRGQAFALQAVGDGALESSEARPFVSRLTEGAEFDEDAQGFRRFVSHGSDWMRSRLLHEGVEQRIRVETIEPVLRALLHDVERYMSDCRGELSAIVQHAYTLAAPHAQRVVRGARERRRLPGRRLELMRQAVLCATLEVQRVFRGASTRWRLRRALVSKAGRSLVPLQASVRGFLLRRRIAHEWEKLRERQALTIQRVFRGFRCRGKALEAVRVTRLAQNADLRGWAALILQRHTRAWLAKRVVYARRVEVGLTSRLGKLAGTLKLAECSWRVSSLLQQVDNDYRRYEKTIGEIKALEQDMAATFVEKVLERRDADVADAWNGFVRSAVMYVKARRDRCQARRSRPTSLEGARSDHVDETAQRKLEELIFRYLDPAEARTLPSPYLRAALPAHASTQSGIVLDARSPVTVPWQRFDESRDAGGDWFHGPASMSPAVDSRKISPMTTMVLGAEDSSPFWSEGQPGASQASGMQRNGATSTEGRLSSAAGDTEADVPETELVCAVREAQGSGGVAGGASVGRRNDSPQASERPCGTLIGAQRGDVFPVKWEVDWDAERKRRGLLGRSSSRFPGSSARQDLPLGLDESIEQFCTAAFLRGHVPTGLMPAGTTPEGSFLRYLELPPSLAKIRHEQLCRDASQPIADHLRARRYVRVRQLLPASKLQHLFKEAGADEEEILAAVALLRELRSGVTDSGGEQPLSSSSSSSSCMSTSRGGLRKAGVGSNATSAGSWGVTGRLSPEQRKSQGRQVNGRRKPLRISVSGLNVQGTASCQSNGSHGAPWDPRRYASRGELWFKPPESIVKRRWDTDKKRFVSVNYHSFDGLYRKHYPQCSHGEDSEGIEAPRTETDQTGRPVLRNNASLEGEPGLLTKGSAGGGHRNGVGCGCPSPSQRPVGSFPEGRREECDEFQEDMTPSAWELHQLMLDDVASWGRVEDPVETFLCRAAFYVVPHPSPPTDAEVDAARQEDRRTKEPGGDSPNRLARPVFNRDRFPPGEAEKELLMDAGQGREQVPLGLRAFRAFVKELDATVNFERASPLPDVRDPSPAATPTVARRKGRAGCPPADSRRVLLERRVHAAGVLARPFAFRLESDGISSVGILASVPLGAWELPPCVMEQVDRMLAVLVAKTCASEYFRQGRRDSPPAGRNTHPEQLSSQETDPTTGRSGSTTRGIRRLEGGGFDPRFQRSALDPFGRPPRLDRIRPRPGLRQEEDGFASNSAPHRRHHGVPDRVGVPSGDDLPPGIWEGHGNHAPLGKGHIVLGGRMAKREERRPGYPSGPGDLWVMPGMPRYEFSENNQRCNLGGAIGGAMGRKTAQDYEGGVEPSPEYPGKKRLALEDTGGSDRHEVTSAKARYEKLRHGIQNSRAVSKVPPPRDLSIVCGSRSAQDPSTAGYRRYRRTPQLFRDFLPSPREIVESLNPRLRLRAELLRTIEAELHELQTRAVCSR